VQFRRPIYVSIRFTSSARRREACVRLRIQGGNVVMPFTRKAVVAAALVAAWATTASAEAAVINYTEGPDLASFSEAPTNLGALDVGTNTVSGSVAFDLHGAPGLNLQYESDRFIVSLGSGLQITKVSLTVSNLAGVNFAGLTYALTPPTTVPINFNDPIAGDGVTDTFLGAASGSGELALVTSISTTFVFPFPTEASNGSFNYSYAIEVRSVPVPEPATTALLGAGLAGLGLMRRRTTKDD
jgi:hypothetical protein